MQNIATFVAEYVNKVFVCNNATFGTQIARIIRGIVFCSSLTGWTEGDREELKMLMKRGVSGFAWFIVLAIPAALALPSASYADGVALPPPSVVGVIDNGLYSAQLAILNNFGSVTGTQTFDYGYNPSLDGTTTDTITASYLNGVATISGIGASTGAAGNSPPQLYSQVDVYINFEVVGPVSYVSVPVIYSATGTTSATGGYATVGFAGYDTSSLIACSPSCADEPSSFSGSLGGTVYSNDIAEFGLSLFGQSGGNFSGPGGWSASVDPTVEIDPAFLANNPGYSLIIDPNPSGTSTVTPEPGTLALFGSGLLVLARVVRRRMHK
jgi:hypothetical protein